MSSDDLAQPVQVIAKQLAEWEIPYVDLAIFETAEPLTIARTVDAFCREQLGAGITQYLFCNASIGSVHGVVLDDGRRVVVKAQQPDKSLAVAARGRADADPPGFTVSLCALGIGGACAARDGARDDRGARRCGKHGGCTSAGDSSRLGLFALRDRNRVPSARREFGAGTPPFIGTAGGAALAPTPQQAFRFRRHASGSGVHRRDRTSRSRADAAGRRARHRPR